MRLRHVILIATLSAVLSLSVSLSARSQATAASWASSKAAQAPVNQLPAEYLTPQVVPVATLGWEDGIYVSRDGLNLYCYYAQYDVIKTLLDGANVSTWPLYKRGPFIGQDYTNPVPPNTFEWLHSDVAYSHRATQTDSWSPWTLSNVRGQFYNLGAPAGVLNRNNPALYDLFVFTHDNGAVHIELERSVGLTGTAIATATLLPANVAEPAYHQDNPHIERPDPACTPNTLVLVYDSDNKPGLGDRDIWLSVSTDNGSTWSNPTGMSSVNTAQYDAQPHLWLDQWTQTWWLFWSSYNALDGKFGIYRAHQATPGNWNSWTGKQLVISTGNAVAIGEPTLTASGDIYFAVSVRNTVGPTQYDTYDVDPWVMRHK